VQAGNVIQAAGGRAAARGEHLLRRLLRRRRGGVVFVAVVATAGRRGAPVIRFTASALRLPCTVRTGSLDLRKGSERLSLDVLMFQHASMCWR